MLSRLFVLLAVILCGFFLYEGFSSATSKYERQLPAPLPVVTARKLLGSEKEYLSVGANPAFQQTAPNHLPKRQASATASLKALARKITLKGLIDAPGTRDDRAIIADQATGEESLLRIGDTIHGLTVISITKHAVTLQAQSGKIELPYAM